MIKHPIKQFIFFSSACLWPLAAQATNGMNLETYGPIAGGMGGAAIAYDNGNAGMMNNPATLSLMEEGSRFDLALGLLAPDVRTTVPVEGGGSGRTEQSSADAYYMPAAGWVRRDGDISYGIGMFAQGGMGTEYDASSDLALMTGDNVKSELSVGRLLFPLSVRINDRLSVGGSADFVWAGLDLKMAVPLSQMAGMSPGGSMAPMLNDANATGTGNWGVGADAARFDYDDGGPYSGDAFGTGYAGKIGLVFKATEHFVLGASYHSKTWLNDLETNDASLSMHDDTDGDPSNGAEAIATINGKIMVKNFQWPAFIGVGAAWQASPQLLLALDVKHIQWSEVLASFDMRFETEMGDLTVSLPQQWEDQTVVAMGAAYQVNEQLILRGGYNHGDNPVPNSFVNALFPATVESHYTLGFGYLFDAKQQLNFSLMRGKQSTVKNSQTLIETSHSQLNWQLMYSYQY